MLGLFIEDWNYLESKAIQQFANTRIMQMFEKYNIDLTGKNVVILGRSNIVGKPLMHCCLNKNATVTVCHSKTQNLAQKAKEADILISAIGKAQFVTADMVKENAVVIDVGINRLENGKITGDVDFENVKENISIYPRRE